MARGSLDTVVNDPPSPTTIRPTMQNDSSRTLKQESHVADSSKSPLSPSVRLLFSFISQRDVFLFLVPAFFASLFSGAIAPFMTLVIGQAFDAFSRFPLTNPTPADRSQLRHEVGISAAELVALAAGSFALSSLTSALWISTGERNVMRVRQKVYSSVARRTMDWFDTEMPGGAGGLMAQFTKDTDDVRMASSLASGMLVQYLTTCLACLILAFVRSWALTLVILSALPTLLLVQGLFQGFASPLINKEREQTNAAATLVERAISAIATVKGFNAQEFEQSTLAGVLEATEKTATKINVVFGTASAFSQFVTMAMFVQGFWFGAFLVRHGHSSPGDVMTVFWACLIATSNLQMCIPQFITLTKGKVAMVALVNLIGADEDLNTGIIVPDRCLGDISLEDVTFVYPSRPTVSVLRDVTLYFPANEMTFVVGNSGSGKSTIGNILARIYRPQRGTFYLDDQDVSTIDETWLRKHIAVVSQNCILFEGSVHDNVALGVAGSGRRPEDVSRQEVIDACTTALMHQFVRDLPNGYETQLGNGGAKLSGGQMQRLAIARAILRDPTVLVLDEATSALDATSRVLVFEAIKTWRYNKTTIVITHDLSQISVNDFVYVLKDGEVVEQGYRHDIERRSIADSIEGEFRKLMEAQGERATGEDPVSDAYRRRKTMQFLLEQANSELPKDKEAEGHLSKRLTALSGLQSFFGNDMMDILFGFSQERDTNRRSIIESLQAPGTEDDRTAVSRTADFAVKKRSEHSKLERKWTDVNLDFVVVDGQPVEPPSNLKQTTNTRPDSLIKVFRRVFPTIPRKPLIFFGVLICIASGAMTPLFSFLLSKLLFQISIGAENTSYINKFGGIVLGVAAADGLLVGLKFFVMETGAMTWVTKLRNQSYGRVLAQDKKFFDKDENSPVHITQMLIKDGDDARNLISVVLAQLIVVATMLSVGFIWALISGWQLTLAGVAIGPIFALVMVAQAHLIGNCERKNKAMREEISKDFYECVMNIRAIRSMSFEKVFNSQFDEAVSKAYSTGVRGAFVEGCTYGVASGLIYLAEALLFFVGAVLVSEGTYTYLQMVEVLNLVIFTVTIGSQLMAFTQRIAKATEATRDFSKMMALSLDTEESHGSSTPFVSGRIEFTNVDFAYPERPEVQVLNKASFAIRRNEMVAIVGSSGSGKSTVTALLQRLYEPQGGLITIDGNDVSSMNVRYLRSQMALVSQSTQLFDASISENISYGDPMLSVNDICRAAKFANVHDFIMGLPRGYDTLVGENATLVSGGQAQRIQIARALARDTARILIFDECTSALDPTTQLSVMESINAVRSGRTTVIVTHKLPVMKLCDRIIVVHDGGVAETGSFRELMRRNGLFAQLARGGEWSG